MPPRRLPPSSGAFYVVRANRGYEAFDLGAVEAVDSLGGMADSFALAVRDLAAALAADPAVSEATRAAAERAAVAADEHLTWEQGLVDGGVGG